MSRTKNQYYFVFIAVIAALSGLLFGYDTGVISGAILFITREFHLSTVMNGFVVSSVLVGACVGALISGRLTDHLGRKTMMVIDASIFILATLMTALASSVMLLVIGRMFVGIAIGIASFTAPLYISEIAPPKFRGAMVSLNQLAIATGILISYVVDYVFSHEAAWRWMFAMGIVPALCLLMGLFFLPFSPRWIVMKGNKIQALSILKKIRLDTKVAEKELQDIHDSMQHKKTTWRTLFSKPIRVSLVIGIMLPIIQQVTGINTILYYAPTIFQSSGFHSASSAIFVSVGIGLIFFLASVAGLFLIDRVGRKPLLYVGLFLMAFSLGMIMWAFQLDAALMTTKILLISGVLIYVMAFAFSLGPVMWLLIAEIFPTRVRGFGAGIATFFNWGSNWLVAMTFLSLIHMLGKTDTFGIYFVACLLSLLFIRLYVPETKHRTLEHIETNLLAGRRLRHLGDELCS